MDDFVVTEASTAETVDTVAVVKTIPATVSNLFNICKWNDANYLLIYFRTIFPNIDVILKLFIVRSIIITFLV